MPKCKECGVEIPTTKFDQFFTDEAIANKKCPECIKKEKEGNYKIAKAEVEANPTWFERSTREYFGVDLPEGEEEVLL